VVDFSQGFGFAVVEWVAFPWVSVYRAWELLVAVKLTEHETFQLITTNRAEHGCSEITDKQGKKRSTRFMP
jgi:hypothetical protein